MIKTNNFQKEFYSTKGFTLIELLLVVGIISLLSTFSFFNITEAKKKGEDAHMKAEASEVRKAIELYKLDNDGRVPNPGLKGQMVREGAADGYYSAAMEKLVDGGYLKEVPTSPSGESYAYLATDDETQAVFAAELNFENSDDSTVPNTCSVIDSGDAYIDNCTGYRNNLSFGLNTEKEFLIKTANAQFAPVGASYTCSAVEAGSTDLDFDSETEICVTASAGGISSYCTITGVCQGVADGINRDDGLCQNYYLAGYVLNGDPFCTFNTFFDVYICDYVEPEVEAVCNGTNDNDYCSCI